LIKGIGEIRYADILSRKERRRMKMYLKKLISLEDARSVGETALAKAMENPDRPMAIAIVDATGELVYFVKMDNSQPLYAKMAMNKAYTVVHFGMDTAEIGRVLKKDGLGVRDFVDPKFTSVGGGVCLRATDGSIIGAIGSSGRQPVIDKVGDLDVSLAGAKALSL
jgi:glc operon protein GlcG